MSLLTCVFAWLCLYMLVLCAFISPLPGPHDCLRPHLCCLVAAHLSILTSPFLTLCLSILLVFSVYHFLPEEFQIFTITCGRPDKAVVLAQGPTPANLDAKPKPLDTQCVGDRMTMLTEIEDGRVITLGIGLALQLTPGGQATSPASVTLESCMCPQTKLPLSPHSLGCSSSGVTIPCHTQVKPFVFCKESSDQNKSHLLQGVLCLVLKSPGVRCQACCGVSWPQTIPAFEFMSA